MTTKREKARQKYRTRYGTEPASDTALTTFMASLTTSDFAGCSDSYSASCDNSASYGGDTGFSGCDG